jgi:hypothetical protein
MQNVKLMHPDRLLKLAEALDVPLGAFGLSDSRVHGADDGPTSAEQGLRLNKHFLSIKNSALREAIVAVVAELSVSEIAGWH